MERKNAQWINGARGQGTPVVVPGNHLPFGDKWS